MTTPADPSGAGILDELAQLAKRYEHGPRVRYATWAEIALVRIAQLWRDTRRLELTGDSLKTVQDHLVEAVRAAQQPQKRWERLIAWWNGSNIERVWRRIHAVDEILLQHMALSDLMGRIPGLYEYARKYLGDQDPRVVRLHAVVGSALASTSPSTPAERIRRSRTKQTDLGG